MLERIRAFLRQTSCFASPQTSQPERGRQQEVGLFTGAAQNGGDTFYQVYLGGETTHTFRATFFHDLSEKSWGPQAARPARRGEMIEVGRLTGYHPDTGELQPGITPIRKTRFLQLPDARVHCLLEKFLELKPEPPLVWPQWLQERHLPKLSAPQIQHLLTSEHDQLRQLGVRLSGHIEPSPKTDFPPPSQAHA